MKLKEQQQYFEKKYFDSTNTLQERLKKENEARLKERELNDKNRAKIELKIKQLQKRIETEENEGSERISDSTNDILISNLHSKNNGNDNDNGEGAGDDENEEYNSKKRREGKRTRLEMKRQLISLQQVESIQIISIIILLFYFIY